MNNNRIENRRKLMIAIKEHKNFDGQLIFPEKSEGMTNTVWFGFVAFLKKKVIKISI